jgi:chromate transporter
VTVLCLALWWLPVLACGLLGGWQGIHFQQGLFFSKAALVTFGGAYAVLPYVAQMAVEHHGWLGQRQMMAGLGLAESTPGPLIMVLQFVGFVAAWQNPGGLPPLLAATLGAAITTWVTFLPCFLFVFLGAPHVEGLRERPALSATLGAITAAVVGVILNLAIWFGWHAVRPVAGTIDGFVVVVAIGAWLAMERFKVGVIPTLAACALLGIAWAMMVPAVGWAPRDRRG